MPPKGKRPGRSRPSSIDQLPEDVRVQINAALRDRRLTQKQILAAINPALEARGEKVVSKSALGRYAVTMGEKMAMRREAQAAADALVGGLGENSGTDLGRAVTEMVKTLAFDMVVSNGELDVDTLNKVALIAQRIERASKINLEKEQKIRELARQEALEEAAEKAEETAIQSGMNEEQAQWMRERILGVR